MHTRSIQLAAFCLLLAACGEQESPPAAQPPAAPAWRIVDANDTDAACEPNETLLSAYCFADAGGSISASGPAIRADASGRQTVTCLTGGPHLRLICAPKP
jgi:hypothetical protein